MRKEESTVLGVVFAICGFVGWGLDQLGRSESLVLISNKIFIASELVYLCIFMLGSWLIGMALYPFINAWFKNMLVRRRQKKQAKKYYRDHFAHLTTKELETLGCLWHKNHGDYADEFDNGYAALLSVDGIRAALRPAQGFTLGNISLSVAEDVWEIFNDMKGDFLDSKDKSK